MSFEPSFWNRVCESSFTFYKIKVFRAIFKNNIKVVQDSVQNSVQYFLFKILKYWRQSPVLQGRISGDAKRKEKVFSSIRSAPVFLSIYPLLCAIHIFTFYHLHISTFAHLHSPALKPAPIYSAGALSWEILSKSNRSSSSRSKNPTHTHLQAIFGNRDLFYEK